MSELSEVRDACFGVNLQQQGRGFYIALELLAIIRGTAELDGTILDPEAIPIIRRRSHDAARRLAAFDLADISSSQIDELGGVDVVDLLGRLFRSLMVSIPGRREVSLPWQQLYLTPYVGELIHWDAVQRKRRGGGAAIEEYSFRGVGAHAHWLLRTDPDKARLDSTRSGLASLVEDADTPLGTLGRAAGARDQAIPRDGDLDDRPISQGTTETPWIEHVREGVNRIVVRQLPREKRIEMLMHFVPFAMAQHFLRVADVRLERTPPRVHVVDFTSGPGPVRTLARQHYKNSVSTIVDAMDSVARRNGVSQSLADSERRRKWAPPRSFFSGTMSMIGALNAPVGSQHYTLKLPLLEALVAATVRPQGELEFSSHCRRLADDFGLVIDARSASDHNMLESANAYDFEQNQAGLADRLRALGVLQDFSDSTRMVSIPELRTS